MTDSDKQTSVSFSSVSVKVKVSKCEEQGTELQRQSSTEAER
jgi:hypothetical protein